MCVFLWFIFSFFLIVCLSLTVKWLAVKTVPKMTDTVSGEALNSTQSSPVSYFLTSLFSFYCTFIIIIMCISVGLEFEWILYSVVNVWCVINVWMMHCDRKQWVTWRKITLDLTYQDVMALSMAGSTLNVRHTNRWIFTRFVSRPFTVCPAGYTLADLHCIEYTGWAWLLATR